MGLAIESIKELEGASNPLEASTNRK